MRFISNIIISLALSLLVVGTATAQTAVVDVATTAVSNTLPPAVKRAMSGASKRLADYNLPGLDKSVIIESLVPLDLVQVLMLLDEEADLKNVVISKGVQGLTTRLKLQDVTAADALEVVLSVNNLAYQVDGGIIKIMTDEEYKLLYGVSFFDQKKVKVIELKYADPVRVAASLANVKSTIGMLYPDAVTGSIILIDTPESIAAMEAIIHTSDIPTINRVMPTETRTYALNYAAVDDIAKELATVITKDAGVIRTDKRTKTLMVTDLPHILEKTDVIVKTFDRKPKQVFIEAKIVEVSLSDDFSMGVNWENIFQGLDPRFSLASVAQPGLPAAAAGSLTYKTIVGGNDLSVILEALKTIGKTEIISNPHIAVMDGEEASIEVIEDQPYKEIQFETGTTNITGVTYQFKKVGVQLAVTPRINDANFISISVKPEISSISQWYDGAPQEGTPVIKKAVAETTVVVKDGVTIIIGGMIKDRKDEGTTKIPILGSIPLLGRLFRYDTSSTVNSETVVFLTPRLTDGEQTLPLLRDMRKPAKGIRTSGPEAKDSKPTR